MRQFGSESSIEGSLKFYMVIVAQSVRAPDCGSGGRGFESRLSPKVSNSLKNFFKRSAKVFEVK